jgi:hypothetical protein
MSLSSKKLFLDIINLFTFLIVATIGILIQINYHLGRKSDEFLVFGFDRAIWNSFHSIFSFLFILGLIYHLYLNFPSLKNMFTYGKKSIPKKLIVSRILTLIIIFMVITGLVSYVNNLTGNQEIRFMFIEIHDKLGIIISILFILHFVQHYNFISQMLHKKLLKIKNKFFNKRLHNN